MFIPLHDGNALKHIKLQYVTLVIIALNVGIWLLTATPTIADPSQLRLVFCSYGFIPAAVFDFKELPAQCAVIPESATFITYSFLHGGFMHLAGNMLFIWVFGDNVEDAMGHLRFLIFYLVCAAAGAFAHGFFASNSEAPLIGASGAAAGIVAAYLVLHPSVRIWILALGRIPIRLEALYVIGAWILFQVYQFATSTGDQVSWAAHIGGLIAGAVLIIVLRRPGVVLFDRALHAVVMPEPVAVPDSSQEPAAEDVHPAKPKKWGR